MNRFSLPYLIFISLIVCVMGFTGCANPEDEDDGKKSVIIDEPVPGGIYHVSLPSNPPSLDPAYVQDKYSVSIVKQIFDGLVGFDHYLAISPALAETWQIKENGKVYRFVLRKNIKFHNQAPVTSRDVAFSIKRLLRLEIGSAVLPHLMKIVGARDFRMKTSETLLGLEIENDREFSIRLEESHVPFLTALGMYQAAIVPEKTVKNQGDEFGRHPVGSGPFRFVSWDENKLIQLARFNAYYAGQAYLDEVQYKIYPKGQDRKELGDFQNNSLEEMAVYGDVRETLAGTKGLQWFHRPSLSLFFYGMNTRHPNLLRPELRKALSAAIDRQDLVKQVYKGQFDIATTILPPGMPGYTPQNKSADKDPQLAHGLLDRYRDAKGMVGPELEIVSAFKTPRVEKEFEIIKKSWAAIGITVNVKYIGGWKDFEAYLRSDAVQIFRYAWFADMPDPDSFLYSLFASESPNNFMKFKDSSIDSMLLTARGIVAPVKRADMYRQIEADILAAAPLIPLFYMSVDQVYQPCVKSVNVSALGAHTMPLNRVWLDESLRK